MRFSLALFLLLLILNIPLDQRNDHRVISIPNLFPERRFHMQDKYATKFFLTLIFLISPVSILNAAVVGFTGPFDVSNWNQFTNTGGSFDLSNAPDSIRLQGGNNQGGGGGGAYFSITLANDQTLGFSWAFNATETPFWDPIGYSIDGAFTKLTNDSGPFLQSGTVVGLSVRAGQTFAFEARTLDNILGPSTLTISDFSSTSAVPEPTSFAIFGCTVAGMSLLRIRKKSRPEELHPSSPISNS